MMTVEQGLGRVLVVVVDRAHARFFEVGANDPHAVELPGLSSPAMRGGKFHSDRQGGPGWGGSGRRSAVTSHRSSSA